MRIEWRYGDRQDALITVDDDGRAALEVWELDRTLLSDFLNMMTGLDNHSRQPIAVDGPRDPEEWGKLVIARSDEGDVFRVDPELYWDRVSHWFRSQGSDPNPYRQSGQG